ncbi:MAG: TIGR04086 family membrane protein [Fusicatenibacter sp.]|nr:TIGR04086 family membrane protein [Fusicatenibacter sp.]
MDGMKRYSQKIAGMIRAMAAAYLVSAALLLFLSLLLLKFSLTEGQVMAGIIVTYLLSCFLGGRMIGKAVRMRKFLWGLAAGICYFLLLMGISALFLPGDFKSAAAILTTFAICAGSGMAGGMFSGA